MYQVEHFKTEFVRTSHAKIMGRGRLALTLRQLMMAIACGLFFSMAIRLLPISNWFAAIGLLIGIWLGSERDGALQLARLFMPFQVYVRSLIEKPCCVDISAEWQEFSEEKNETI